MLVLGRPEIRFGFYCLSVILLYLLCVGVESDLPALSQKVTEYGHFFFIGLLAATVANSTGAGGGIIFLPAFMALGVTPQQALATSFAIQCFGMTSGALAWLNFSRSEWESRQSRWHGFSGILFVSSLGSIIGLVLAQQFIPSAPFNIHVLFSVFSLFVGFAVLYRTLRYKEEGLGRQTGLSHNEKVVLFFISVAGGAITAWLSIGIGEILAIVLLRLGYRVHIAVAAAVCVSSISVLTGVIYHANLGDVINYNILLFAAPAAMIGGAIARRVAVLLGAKRLKIMMACWIIISAIVYL
ncbi:sulfite exporter TauE/SafE family protein [Pleionea sp. CnH1-48]|uniref:sulfite exporter TauE/SafE family protein n=1 Tax=Pleionea sp. CnH1-48 TaxID=2954494 RepID=UPI0020975717|nr:sulfite exporter TauE/SafE family protein [Pleionea sp. CnH1-48]MCO7225526.1 sulfite exporter TauE/SafE family protein [Pleionea sp. CnH1-48]